MSGIRNVRGGVFDTQLHATSYAVRTSGLTKQYRNRVVVRDLELTVPEGSVYVLAGPNGAGKTTTIRMLLGLLHPTRGSATVFGLESGPGGATRARIGYVPEGKSIPYAWMRVSDLLAHHASYFSSWDAAYAERLSEQLQLRLGDRYGKLSKGEARRVELVMALAHRPSLLLLDEPTDGLDPVVRAKVLRILSEHMSDTPTTMLIATHLIYEMEGLADHIGIMQDGALVAQLNRDAMQAKLRRYVLEVPATWTAPSLPFAVLNENGNPRERRWTVWGEEDEVRVALEHSGAQVRSVSGLTLDEAALVLLQQEQRT